MGIYEKMLWPLRILFPGHLKCQAIKSSLSLQDKRAGAAWSKTSWSWLIALLFKNLASLSPKLKFKLKCHWFQMIVFFIYLFYVLKALKKDISYKVFWLWVHYSCSVSCVQKAKWSSFLSRSTTDFNSEFCVS